jgi:hypothetical protein
MSTLIFKALVRIKDSAPIFSAFTSSPAKNAPRCGHLKKEAIKSWQSKLKLSFSSSICG